MLYSDNYFSDFSKKVTSVQEILKNYEQSIKTASKIVGRYQKSLPRVQQPCKEISTILNQLNHTYTDALSSFSETIASVTFAKNTFSEQYKVLNDKISSDFTEALRNLYAISLQTLDDSFDSSSNVSFADVDAFIPDNAFKNISNTIDVPAECIHHPNTKERFIQISVKDFLLCILFPLVLAIIPMLRSDYLDSRNALEAEKESLKTESYQERVLQLDQDILDTNEQISFYLKQISDTLNNLQESQQSPCEKEDCSSLSPSDILPTEESDAADNNALDESNASDNTD